MILFGASGHAKVILDILFLTGQHVEMILDDNPKFLEIYGVPVKMNDETSSVDSYVIISIGNNAIRKEITKKYHFKYTSAIHPSAIISDFCKIGEGTVVMANAVINASSVIGSHCILNTASVIEHDCVIEDFVHISPNVSLAGSVHIGEGSHIGIGASVIQGVRIGKGCKIGAGAVVIRDVPDFAVVVGNPGKIIKYNEPK